MKYSLLCAILLSVPAFSQTAGTIVGAVRDPQHASIPGTTVTATHTLTGATRTASSDSNGDFVFAQMAVGEYTVATEATGFQKQTAKVVLQVDQTARVDFNMILGTVATVTQVEAAASVLKTDTSDVGTV